MIVFRLDDRGAGSAIVGQVWEVILMDISNLHSICRSNIGSTYSWCFHGLVQVHSKRLDTA